MNDQVFKYVYVKVRLWSYLCEGIFFIYLFIYLFMCVCVCVCVRAYVFMYIHTCIRTYTRCLIFLWVCSCWHKAHALPLYICMDVRTLGVYHLYMSMCMQAHCTCVAIVCSGRWVSSEHRWLMWRWDSETNYNPSDLAQATRATRCLIYQKTRPSSFPPSKQMARVSEACQDLGYPWLAQTSEGSLLSQLSCQLCSCHCLRGGRGMSVEKKKTNMLVSVVIMTCLSNDHSK